MEYVGWAVDMPLNASSGGVCMEEPKRVQSCVSSRRRAIRIEAPAGLTVAVADRRIKAQVVDIGLGGICLATNLPLSRGVSYGLTLRLGRQVASCDAKAAHCRRDASGQWIVGMSFVRDERYVLVEQLLDSLTGSLIEFS